MGIVHSLIYSINSPPLHHSIDILVSVLVITNLTRNECDLIYQATNLYSFLRKALNRL